MLCVLYRQVYVSWFITQSKQGNLNILLIEAISFGSSLLTDRFSNNIVFWECILKTFCVMPLLRKCDFCCEVHNNSWQSWNEHLYSKQYPLFTSVHAFGMSFYVAYHCEVCYGVTGEALWLQFTVKPSSMICFQGLLWVLCGRMIYRLTWILLGLIRFSKSIVIDSFATLPAQSCWCWYIFWLKMASHHCPPPFMSSECHFAG